jgi:7-cyano-7-deazaguanine synthase
MKTKTEKRRVLILFSGGLDSTILVNLATNVGYEPELLLIDYDQKHRVELDAAIEYAQLMKHEFRIIEIPITTPSQLTDGSENHYPGVSEWHVPSRNLIFLAHATSIAEGMGIDLIWYGANYADREHLFPDCSQEWVFKLNGLLEINGSAKIKVEAPLLGMSKELLTDIANHLNINLTKIHSGYEQERQQGN